MLGYEEVFDPPEIGFDGETITAALEKARKYKLLLDSIESQFNLKTSTPLKSSFNWDTFCVEICIAMASKLIDNDSGYVSNHQESNSTDLYNENDPNLMVKEKFVYMNEDALLEKPTSSDVSRIEDSVSSEEERFAGLRDSIYEESGISNKTTDSPVIPKISPIVISKEKFELITGTGDLTMDTAISNTTTDSSVISYINPIVITKQKLELITDTEDVTTETGISNETTDSPVIPNISPIVITKEKLELITGTEDLKMETGISNETTDSLVIPTISPIVIPKEKFELITRTDNIDLGTTVADLSTQKLDLVTENCDNDLNTENNLNYLNIQSRAATLLSLSVFEKSKESIQKAETQAYQNIQLFNITQTPEKTYKNSVNASMSPDLFSDDDLEVPQNSRTPKVELKERYLLKQDRKLFRRGKEMLSGVPPPTSLQYVNLTVSQMLERYEQNKHLLLTKEEMEEKRKKGDEIVNNCDLTFLITKKGFESVNKNFPSVLEERYHGLHYNRSRISEEMEQLAMKYASKYIGCETHSSCTVFRTNFPSSPSKNSSRLRWAVKSPGKRLSHLARRRITFSSANLQAQTRQVAVDPRRLKLLSRKKSPLKKSPRKTPKKSPTKRIKTPSSSAKKKLSMQLRLMAEQMPTTSKVTATKRALFQSPEKIMSATASTSKLVNPSLSGACLVSPFKRRTNLKCVLFASPTKSSPSKTGNKRKRTDSDTVHPSKLPKTLSLPEACENKTASKVTLVRVKSEVLTRSPARKAELSETHKKKLLWAIYEALRGQKVPMNHPQYKQYAAVLFRVTKRFLPDLSANAPRPEGGTSEGMLKIARQHVCAVLQGKSVDQIIQEYEQKRLKCIKPSGYITIEDAKKMDVSKAKENVLKEKVNNQIGIMSLKPEVKKIDRIDKVRKVINFDGDGGVR